ncbi:hypothetical protein BJX65DRAFT_272071 [Aspergillus insuetus]
MEEASRSLSACLRCRRKKLKCGGPSEIPCRRCRARKEECVFVPPKPIRAVPSSTDLDENVMDRLSILEQRLDAMEERHRAEIRELQNQISQLQSVSQPLSADAGSATSQSILPVPSLPGDMGVVSRDLINESEWEELYEFFYENCRNVVGFVDDQIYYPRDIAAQYPLMATVICIIAARAIRPEKYQVYLAEADEMIKNTFAGPAPDIHAVRALMLLTAWTGRTRLWGYVASLCAELGLNTAALQLGDDAVEHTADLVQRARTWFTLCCFDLMANLNRPFVINKMREYLPFAKNLLASPYCQPVDHRICAYIVGFTITADAKAQLPKTQLRLNPLRQEDIECLTMFDQRLDGWFYKVNNTLEPHYQTFADRQDRNRFMIPYAFMKIYVNGFALHGIPPDGSAPDRNRVFFIQRALDNACLLVRVQFESESFRQRLRYTIDYNGTSTYQAINFILKALPAAYQDLKCDEALTALRQAAEMFEQAGATDAAREVRRERKRMALLTQTVLSSPEDANSMPDLATLNGELFDIPNFLDAATWDEPFPTLDLYMLD